MTAAYECDAQRSVNLIVATLTIAAGVIWTAADYSSAHQMGSGTTLPPSSEVTAWQMGSVCSPVGPNAQTQAVGTAARESLFGVDETEGSGGKSSDQAINGAG
jgi:hypothetical protein